jgi:predicted CopG family antitoxin
MFKEIEISVEAYNLLEQAKLPGEDFSDTLLRLVRKYEQVEFIKHQKQILEKERFYALDEAEK